MRCAPYTGTTFGSEVAHAASARVTARIERVLMGFLARSVDDQLVIASS